MFSVITFGLQPLDRFNLVSLRETVWTLLIYPAEYRTAKEKKRKLVEKCHGCSSGEYGQG